MTRFNLNVLLLLTLALLAGPRVVQAAESYDNCTGVIATLPTVISTQGTWCMEADLATSIASGNAISINTDNVTIDCNDFKLDGSGAGLATATVGISGSNRFNAIVRNCHITGFYQGLRLSGTGGGHVVEDNLAENNTYFGLNVQGDGSIVRRNRVFDTGGSTTVAPAYGIYSSLSVDILDNTVSGVTARATGNGSAFGIYTLSNASGSMTGNRIRGLAKDGTGQNRGIYNDSSGRVTLSNNDLVAVGGTGTLGLRCANANGSAKNNVINGYVTGFSGCSTDGGNVVVH
jgi:hypothetical protein